MKCVIGAPSAAAINKAKAGKTQGSTSEALKPQQKAMLKRVKARFPRLKPGTQEEIVMLVKPKGQINSKRFVELGQAYDKMDMKKLDQLIAKYAKGFTIVVEKSTLPVKTAQTIKDILKATSSIDGFLFSDKFSVLSKC